MISTRGRPATSLTGSKAGFGAAFFLAGAFWSCAVVVAQSATKQTISNDLMRLSSSLVVGNVRPKIESQAAPRNHQVRSIAASFMERDLVRWLCTRLPQHSRLLVGP